MRSFLYAALTAVAFAQEPYDPDFVGDWGSHEDDWETLHSYDYTYDEIDDTTTEVTNIYGNKAQKIDQIDIAEASQNWNEIGVTFYGGEQTTEVFSDFLDVWNNDAVVEEQMNSLKKKARDYYQDLEDTLPQVCSHEDGCEAACEDSTLTDCMARCQKWSAPCIDQCEASADSCACYGVGTRCREKHTHVVKNQSMRLWREAIKNAKIQLEQLITQSHNMIESAYESAYNCPHGCGCQFISGTYNNLMWEIEQRQTKIDEIQVDIEARWIEIDEVNSAPCDFNGIIDEWQGRWDSWEREHQEDLAVYDSDYWKTDNWNMDEAVDQDAFNDIYGFDYSAEDFDKYMEEPTENVSTLTDEAVNDVIEDTTSNAASSSSSTSSSSTTYTVNGQEMTEEEYNAFMANQGSTTTTTTTESATYFVNGQEMTEEEYNAYLSEQAVSDTAVPF